MGRTFTLPHTTGPALPHCDLLAAGSAWKGSLVLPPPKPILLPDLPGPGRPNLPSSKHVPDDLKFKIGH